MSDDSASEAELEPVIAGAPWWEDDPEESVKDVSRGQATYACYIVAIGLVAVGLLLGPFPPTCTVTVAAATSSSFVPASLLAGYRVVAGAFALGVTAHRISQTTVQPNETLDGRPIPMQFSGLWRMQGLTQWQFLLIGLFFVGASGLSLSALAARGDPKLSEPSAAACVTSSLLGVSFGLAMLTTVVVTFVLIPAGLKKGSDISRYFEFDDLVMHNANLGMLVVELLIDELHITLADLPYCLGIGLVYVVWHQFIRFRLTHTLLYFFLSWQHKHALKIVIALISAIGCFFLIGVVISEVIRPTTVGPLLVLAGSFAIMRFRP